MSLDLYLEGVDPDDDLCQCPNCGHEFANGKTKTLYETNITHNLGAMAAEAGIYKILWRPEENGIETASQLIEPLRIAIGEMEIDPGRFKKHDSPNGWGLYKHFLPWLIELLGACEKYPDAKPVASR